MEHFFNPTHHHTATPPKWLLFCFFGTASAKKTWNSANSFRERNVYGFSLFRVLEEKKKKKSPNYNTFHKTRPKKFTILCTIMKTRKRAVHSCFSDNVPSPSLLLYHIVIRTSPLVPSSSIKNTRQRKKGKNTPFKFFRLFLENAWENYAVSNWSFREERSDNMIRNKNEHEKITCA